jgi:hypothetical protein
MRRAFDTLPHILLPSIVNYTNLIIAVGLLCRVWANIAVL